MMVSTVRITGAAGVHEELVAKANGHRATQGGELLAGNLQHKGGALVGGLSHTGVAAGAAEEVRKLWWQLERCERFTVW